MKDDAEANAFAKDGGQQEGSDAGAPANDVAPPPEPEPPSRRVELEDQDGDGDAGLVGPVGEL
mgnify:CR=1 FL=1